ncbi:MAG: AAA family ATPase [Sciscionella sp.]|nr:AAA family ATPase [Sciscionella sp.]
MTWSALQINRLSGGDHRHPPPSYHRLPARRRLFVPPSRARPWSVYVPNPPSSARQAEIAVEQRHVDRVYARLAELRTEAKAMRDKGFHIADGAKNEAEFEQAQLLLARDVMVNHANRMLRSLDAEHEGLVFGRLDMTDGETMYVGRLGIRDAEFDNLVTDWRAPAAGAFYQATAERPMAVIRRRVLRCSSETVVDIDDDLLIPDALPDDMPVVGEGALMASLSRARGEHMHNIVATIQREQDQAIRAPWRGVTEITGGPGTGKTAVALHRAAYLLYAERRRMGGAGVLVVGPSAVFTNYISRVLPSMGEDSVELRAVGDVLDGVSASRLDPAGLAAVKGSLRMRKVLRKAIKMTPPDVPTDMRIVYRGEVLRLDDAELHAVRAKVHRAGGPPNSSRVHAAEALLEALWHKAEQAERGFDRDHFMDELAERLDFHQFVVRFWPVLTPQGVLGWLGDRRRLAASAGRALTAAEIDGLAKSWELCSVGAGWSVADVALLDELRVMLGKPRRRRRHTSETNTANATASRRGEHYDEYAHVVVDEAQDLSPMQWRMIGRRGRYASWTIVGDPAQSSWPDPAEAEGAASSALGANSARRRFTLRTNYRNSKEIFDLAAAVVSPVADHDTLPAAVRATGVSPRLRAVDDLPGDVRAAAAELLDEVDGTIGVITAMHRVDEAEKWLAEANNRVHVVGSLNAKGLEYDAVVLVEPCELITESLTGPRGLYVAITRATQRLIVLASDNSWLPARH